MATQAQIEANRRNSQKSTGPRSTEGKAVSRFNALKSGIHAKSQVIPGEDAAELEALAAQYAQQFEPEYPLETFLVDSMIAADWKLRRLRKIEAQLWQRELTGRPEGPDAAADLAEAYIRNPVLAQVQRRIEATERSYYRALNQMQKIQKEVREFEAEDSRQWKEHLRSLPDEEVLPVEGSLVCAEPRRSGPARKLASILPSPNRVSDQPDQAAAQLASFPPSSNVAGDRPDLKGVQADGMPPK